MFAHVKKKLTPKMFTVTLNMHVPCHAIVKIASHSYHFVEAALLISMNQFYSKRSSEPNLSSE